MVLFYTAAFISLGCKSVVGNGWCQPVVVTGNRQVWVDSVEKVGSSRLPTHCLLKMLFLRAATRNPSPESSAQSKDFNLKRVLFCSGSHSRLFQQNRLKAVSRNRPLLADFCRS